MFWNHQLLIQLPFILIIIELQVVNPPHPLSGKCCPSLSPSPTTLLLHVAALLKHTYIHGTTVLHTYGTVPLLGGRTGAALTPSKPLRSFGHPPNTGAPLPGGGGSGNAVRIPTRVLCVYSRRRGSHLTVSTTINKLGRQPCPNLVAYATLLRLLLRYAINPQYG